MTNILILGAYGMVGSSLSPYLKSVGLNVYCQGRRNKSQINLNTINAHDLKKFLIEYKINCVINLIALTKIENCEKNLNEAYEANTGILVSIVEVLESIPENQRPHLISISTDHVYYGNGPHLENDASPCNVYALTKLFGEFIAEKVGATILRTNFIGKSKCNERLGLTDWIVNSLRSDKEITIYRDVLFSPIHISTLCEIINIVINKPISGTFNLGCKSGFSKAELAIQMAIFLKLKRKLMTVGYLNEDNDFVKRPLDMRMNSNLLKKYLIINFQHQNLRLNLQLRSI